MDQKVTIVGFGIDRSWPSFTDLVQALGCLITGYYCDEGVVPRQAGDLRIYGKMDKQNILMLYPSESKDDIAACTEHGDSGGAVLYKDEKGDLVIIGVNSASLDLEDQKEKLNQYYNNFKKTIDVLDAKGGGTKITAIQLIEPGILEEARFRKYGWGKAIRAKNEGLLFKAIEEGVLGVNHDSRGLLLRTAIENELWELAMELVHRGISGVENFGVLYSLADKGAWEIFDTVMEIIKSKADKNENWIKEMTDITLGLNQYEEERITRYFGLIFSALEKKDREEIIRHLDRIKETNKGLGNF
jgi:hypothetical protein